MTTELATEHAQLRRMTLDEREKWMRDNAQFKFRLGLYVLRVDGHLVGLGSGEEFETALLAKFLMFIARPSPGVKRRLF